MKRLAVALTGLFLAAACQTTAAHPSSSSQLDSAGQNACTTFEHAKSESSEQAGIEDIRAGLDAARQSNSPGFLSDIYDAEAGFTPADKADSMLAVCRRYGF